MYSLCFFWRRVGDKGYLYEQKLLSRQHELISIVNIYYLLFARPMIKYFLCIVSLNPHNNMPSMYH